VTYISFCSGIEAASAAWHPLGWTPVAFCEIDKFASRVLAHHYPTVPNLGDFTKVDWAQYSADICVGGTPCQAFSVAGLRNSLADERGNLTLEFVRAINIIRPHTVVWENVPGVLSTGDNAFGCFLAALVGCDEPIVFEQGWPNSGVVDGPDRRAAWRILDAQYFGLAQRRKRVFVVANSGDRPHPAEILFEWEGLRRDSPPSREKGEGVAGTVASRTTGGGGFGTDFEAAGGLQPVAMCLNGKSDVGERLFTAEGTVGVSLTRHGYGTNNQAPLFIDTYNQSTDQHCAKPVCSGSYHDKAGAVLVESSVTHALTASCHQGATEDGTGRGCPLVAVAIQGTMIDRGENSGPCGSGYDESGAMFTLTKADVHAVAHSLRADGFDASEDGTGPGTPLVPVTTLAIRGRGDQSNLEYRTDGTANALLTPNGGRAGIGVGAIQQAMAVRRLLPEECEALQGFTRNYTNIPGAADGTRYRSLGNSMAVPVMAWIGRRIHEAYAND